VDAIFARPCSPARRPRCSATGHRMRAAADQRALGPDVEDAVRLDLDYAENWSLLRDLMIIAKTVKTVLTADGAY
jgi:lipopolysaccharide/colanic/teichoic acid biosynthesis glycosyltransferase